MILKLGYPHSLVILVICAFFYSSINAQINYEEAFPNISFNYPVEIQSSNDGSNRLFVVEQPGVIKVFQNTTSVQSNEVSTFLDITSKVSFSSGQEIGLLGLAFHPNYENNGYVYVYYTDQPSNYRMNVVRYTVSSSNGNQLDTSTETLIFSFTKNQGNSNHNGGKIAFGPDGYLYASIGDGGGGGDPQGNAQDLNNAFGSILRIDVDLDGNNTRAPNGNYEIPSTNPRVGNSGLDELYAWGIRNTWKFSFDSNTLWAADVGQAEIEEINIINRGGNYGWNRFEGNQDYQGSTSLVTSPDTKPIYTYNHNQGDLSITGGYVYRGSISNSDIQGKYVYGDYLSGRVWALAYDPITGSTSNTFLFKTNGEFISSFGLDESGEIYFSDYGTNAKLYKITDESVTQPQTVNVNGIGNWINMGVPGVNGIVEAIANDGSDNYYIGGEFTSASSIAANNVAKYSKQNGWENLGAGTNGPVYTVAVDSNGLVYIGGSFTQVDGVAANNIAVYDGTSWSALGSGASDNVQVITIDENNNVYAGGNFETIGGINVSYVALWNGTWNAFTDTNSGISGTNNEVRSIALDTNGDVIIGGNFDSAGGNSAPRIARWNGTNWSTFGEGTSGFVQALVPTTNYIYAGGNFVDAGGNTVNRIARWNRNSNSWETLGFGLSGNVNTMTQQGNYIYVGGVFETASDEENINKVMNYISRFSDASGWEALGPNTDVGVEILVKDFVFNTQNTELAVVGNFSNAGNITASNVAFWGANSNCSSVTITPEYTINGTLETGSEAITVAENANLILDLVQDIYFTIELPNGNTIVGSYNLSAVTFNDAGTYTFTSTEGCTTSLEITVVQDPNGDADGDGVINANDQCENTPTGESVDTNGCGESQKDDDNDGVFNNLDLCPNTPSGENVDTNGCGESQKDDDNDGIFNNVDICPNTPSNETADSEGCGPSQQDIDNDGVSNTDDLCNATPAGETVDANGCSESQKDDDNDGIANTNDNCPNTPTGQSVDSNGCSQSQLDDDNDGVFNTNDNCPNTPNGESVNAEGCSASQLDDDNDGISNAEDLCSNTPQGETIDLNGCSPSQLDSDNDGVSDAEDACPNTTDGATVDEFGCSNNQQDIDNDGVPNADDLCPNTPPGETVNFNGCAESQLDDDNDGVTNGNDLCPNTPPGTVVDFQGCELSNNDNDQDGVENDDDICPNTPSGVLVDESGCEIFTLPSTNYTISTLSNSCIGVFDGELAIQTERSLDYIASLRGNSYASTANFTSDYTFRNLPADTYELCLTIRNIDNYQKCFTVIIDAPEQLSVSSAINDDNSLITLTMSGAPEYFITLNEISFKTSDNSVTLPLAEKDNYLKVTTEKECQGVFEDSYLISANATLFPNPFTGVLNIALNSTSSSETEMRLYDLSAKLIDTKSIPANTATWEYYTAALPAGIYMLELNIDGNYSQYKVIKR